MNRSFIPPAVGVPVFAADVKGDLAELALPGAGRKAMTERAEAIGVPGKPAAVPVILWELIGDEGSPNRATVAVLEPSLQPEPQPGGFPDGLDGTLGDWWTGGGSSRGRMTNGRLVVRSAIQSASRSDGTRVAREIMRGLLGGLQC